MPPPSGTLPATVKVEEVEHLNTLLAIFKNDNTELVDEVGRLRKELANVKQQNMMMQYTSKDPDRMAAILREMTELSMGNRPRQQRGETGIVIDLAPHGMGDIRECGRDFAAKLESVKPLPGGSAAIPTSEMPTQYTSHDDRRPCVWSQ